MRPSWLRRLYDWVLHWASTPQAAPALLAIAFMESSFFPVPPDVLLIAMAFARPGRAFRYALLCSVGSVLGGMFGYLIGLQFLEWLGKPILSALRLWEEYARVQELYQRYDVWAVGLAGFTPLPYKLFTIAAGAFRIDFLPFVLASALSRSARFYGVAWLVRRFGPSMREWLERSFGLATIVFALLLIGGFLLVKLLL
ncbi:MAG: YqaA family protein [Acidobacteriota bacterium]